MGIYSEKYATAIGLIRDRNYTSVLDLGCREKSLKEHLRTDVRYQGIDYADGDEILGHNLEQGIPFPDDSFDIVFALDVLEHVESVHFLFREMQRVARKEIIGVLPNEYYWKFRLRYLKGKAISDKYTFPAHRIIDRHRWVTSYDSSLDFVEKNNEFGELTAIKGFHQYSSSALRKLEILLAGVRPNFFAYRLIFHIAKQ